ncbi:MAG: hypothetical protein AAFU79_21350, partial [Myxococcota bacterium]
TWSGFQFLTGVANIAVGTGLIVDFAESSQNLDGNFAFGASLAGVGTFMASHAALSWSRSDVAPGQDPSFFWAFLGTGAAMGLGATTALLVGTEDPRKREDLDNAAVVLALGSLAFLSGCGLDWMAKRYGGESEEPSRDARVSLVPWLRDGGAGLGFVGSF